MVIKFFTVALLLLPLIANTQSQFGFGFAYGIGGLISSEQIVQSPQNTFFGSMKLSGQLRMDFFFSKKKFIYEFGAEHNNFYFSASDNSKNILFFPELTDGKGTKISSGGRVNAVNISMGRTFKLNQYSLEPFVGITYMKFREEFYNSWGISLNELDSNNQVIWEWQFSEYGLPNYQNNLHGFGINLKVRNSYFISKRIALKLDFVYTQGLFKIINKSYRTYFIHNFEPVSNATYYNELFSRGSHLQLLFGVKYCFKEDKTVYNIK